MDPHERRYCVLFRVYEMALKEVLTPREYDDLQRKAYRMLIIDDILARDLSDDFTKFLIKTANPTDEEYKEHNKLGLSQFKYEEE